MKKSIMNKYNPYILYIGRGFLSALLFLCSWAVWAESVSQLPYNATFENGGDASEWRFADVPENIFIPEQSVKTHWDIGELTSRYGSSALYVVDDLNNLGYEKACYTIAVYRTFNLPVGEYELTFDWMAGGNNTDGLYVAWIPADKEIKGNELGTLPSYAEGCLIEDLRMIFPTVQDIEQPLRQGDVYQHVLGTVNVPANSNEYNLVFIWLVNNVDDEPSKPAACIDNVQLVVKPSSGDIPEQAHDLTCHTYNGTVNLTWQGHADAYDVEIYTAMSKLPVLHFEDILTPQLTQTTVELSEGVYTIRIKSKDEKLSTRWVEFANVLVYDPTTHCLNYLDFEANGVQCTYGPYTEELSPEVFATQGVVDYGYQSKESRHTIHYIQGETDPRTNGQLKTIPDGALASVRLGNWNGGGYGQSVTYTVDIKEGMGVLQLKYAIVAQSGEHDPYEQSIFYLKILDADGNLINGDCGVADFRPPKHVLGDGWQQGTNCGNGDDHLVFWRDWTTVGINLTDYIGQTIKIQLISTGCIYSVHWGYAYFTLDCSSGEVQGVSCGEKPRTLTVDPGFSYRWSKAGGQPFYEGQDPASSTMYIAPDDTATYFCDLVSLANPDCYFTLKASALKRLPVADFRWRHTPAECRNMVTFSDKSFIMGYYTIDGRELSVPTLDTCTLYEWSMPGADGRDSIFSRQRFPAPVEFPASGADVPVRLHVGMDGGGCLADTVFRVSVPPIGPVEAVTEGYICQGGVYPFHGTDYTTAGDHTLRLTTVAGCDSLLTLRLSVLEVDTVRLPCDTLCSGGVLDWQGQSITAAGTYYHAIPSKVIACDSIVEELPVVVVESLQASLSSVPAEVCGDDPVIAVSYSITGGTASDYDLLFDAAGHAGGFTDLVEMPVEDGTEILLPVAGTDGRYKRPGRYTARLRLHNANGCGNVELPFGFDVLYPDTVIVQRWDDLLGVTNEQWNGGYTFSAYQWYKDGDSIPGATGSYLYVPDDPLTPDSEYRVRLTRSDDGVSMLTCAFRPQSVTDEERSRLLISLTPLSYNGVEVEVAEPARVQVFNALGQPVCGGAVKSKGRLQLPAAAGVYILRADTPDGHTDSRRIVVK